MYEIDSDIVFMCRTYTEIQLHTSILVLLLEQVRTLGRAKARLGRRHSRRSVVKSTKRGFDYNNRKQGDCSQTRKSGHPK